MVTGLRLKKILFATDFLQSSRLALDYAVAFAQRYEAAIEMLHVVEMSQAGIEVELTTLKPCVTRLEAQERLEALASGVRRVGIPVETYVEDGIPHEVILRRVSSHNADMLVLGIYGVHRGLAHLLVGSNAERILLEAACPTLTVGAHALV